MIAKFVRLEFELFSKPSHSNYLECINYSTDNIVCAVYMFENKEQLY